MRERSGSKDKAVHHNVGQSYYVCAVYKCTSSIFTFFSLVLCSSHPLSLPPASHSSTSPLFLFLSSSLVAMANNLFPSCVFLLFVHLSVCFLFKIVYAVSSNPVIYTHAMSHIFLYPCSRAKEEEAEEVLSTRNHCTVAV